eukprot:30990-Pelagococcus_subviridis.AAC.2
MMIERGRRSLQSSRSRDFDRRLVRAGRRRRRGGVSREGRVVHVSELVRARGEPTRADVIEQPPQKRIRTDGRAVAHDRDVPARARERDVHPPPVGQKANRAAVVAANRGHDDALRLSPLKRIHARDFDALRAGRGARVRDRLQLGANQPHLRGVRALHFNIPRLHPRAE